MTEVVVVGAGPAGAAVATWLAERGHDVVVLDRARFPRAKACGEGLFPRGVRALKELGVAERLDSCGAPLERVRFIAGRHEAFAPLGGPNAGLGIARETLDAVLVERARAAGADVRQGVAVRGLIVEGRRAVGVETDEGIVQAGVVIAADGLNSRLRRQAGLDGRHGQRYGISAHATLATVPPPEVRVWFMRGYEVYLTPIGARRANIAILARRPFMRRFAGELREQFAGALPLELADKMELVGEPLAAGPFAQSCSRAWRANVVLAGDAAGFYDGITGEGMSIALESAKDCAEAVGCYLATRDYAGFRTYDARRSGLARNSALLAGLTLALARNPTVAEYAVRNLSRRPETFARLAAINTGEAGMRSLRPRDLLALASGL